MATAAGCSLFASIMELFIVKQLSQQPLACLSDMDATLLFTLSANRTTTDMER